MKQKFKVWDFIKFKEEKEAIYFIEDSDLEEKEVSYYLEYPKYYSYSNWYSEDFLISHAKIVKLNLLQKIFYKIKKSYAYYKNKY